eukprot:TRINITY_DN26714_c0_g1_i1.p1 TRINITY_DN26714_c0_g1~~TRINITY_DN26714_c0_g1_i1.p1  ORF type:complete len:255 (+),score=72.57 TRINITY_DN26714_c0_g1_i1:72-767(+)
MFLRRTLNQARKIHHVLFIEDHTIVTRNHHRMDAVEAAVKKLEPMLKADTCNVVLLNAGYFRENKVFTFGKGEFDAAKVVDLEGNKGSCGVWGNIGRHLRHHECDGNAHVVMITNGGDTCSKLNGDKGIQKMFVDLIQRRPDFKFTASCIGLDIIRPQERRAISTACTWTGGSTLFLDCDGKDEDGTTLTSAEADEFFKNFIPTAKSVSTAKAGARVATILRDVKHVAPSI